MREKITSIVFILILCVIFVFAALLPKDENAEVLENRPMSEMPKVSLSNVFSGDFEKGFEDFLTDNIGFRSKFVKIGTALENARGIQKSDSGKVVTLASGGELVLNDGKIMEVFKKNPYAQTEYIKVLGAVSEKMGGDANLYLMLVPTQIEFDTSKYRALSDSEKDVIDNIYKNTDGFKTVNVYDSLKENTNDYIYFRTDHHWTARGAYLGYRALMKETGSTPVSLSSLTHKKESGFLGYLFNQANVASYSRYADDIEYFMGSENYDVNAKARENGKIVEYGAKVFTLPQDGSSPLYSIFMGGDHPLCEVSTNVKNGKTALVIKDSYANAVLPFLCNNYEKIVVIDPRSYYGTLDDLKNEYKIDDMFIINYVFTSTMTDYIDNLNRIK